MAAEMVSSLNALGGGGAHTMDDFAAVSNHYTDPGAATYKILDLVEHPPNCRSAMALLMLNLLTHFELAAMDPFGAPRAHIEAEADQADL